MSNMFANVDLTKAENLEKIDRGMKRALLVTRLCFLAAPLLVLLGSAWVFAVVGFTWQTGVALGVTFWVLIGVGAIQAWGWNKAKEDFIERVDEIAAERECNKEFE